MKTSLIKTVILLFIISILFKPTWLFNNGTLADEVDDRSYWLHSATLSFDQDLKYVNDYQITKDTIIHLQTHLLMHQVVDTWLHHLFIFLVGWI